MTPTAVQAEDVVGLESVSTLQGGEISVMVSNDGVFLNESTQMIATDIVAENGISHVIDSVLLPPAE